MNSKPLIDNSRIIGFCFLAAFLAYGFGTYYFASINIEKKHLGALLIATNSAIVIVIGSLLRKTIRVYNPRIGNIYLFVRIFEGMVLMSPLINLVSDFNISIDITYFIAMFIFGVGSIAMCYILNQFTITPKWLSIWGLAGYTLFSFGFLMELLGKPWSIYFLGPGGLWEIVFGAWLITRTNNIQ